MLNLAALVVELTIEPLPAPVAETTPLASMATVLLPLVGRITVPKTKSWVLVMVVGDRTVTLALALADTVPAAKALVARAESASAAPAATTVLRIIMGPSTR